MTLLLALLYFASLFAIGLMTVRRAGLPSGFFLAGNSLRLLVVSLSTLASIMSGFVFVGGPGLFYEVGLSSVWIIISGSFTGALMCWVLAKPMYRLSSEAGCLTIPDLILARFGCRLSSGLAALAILLGVIGYLATQIQALGVVLASIMSVPVQAAVLAGVLLLGFYVVAGGMLASVYTDVVQGMIMLATATLVFVYAMRSTGGLEELSLSLLQNDPSALSPWAGVGSITALSWFFLFSVGALGQPHVINKFMMVKNLRVLRYFPLLLALSMLLCGLIWLGVGLAVRGLVADGTVAPLSNSDRAVTSFLEAAAPAWLRSMTLVGIVAAIMSTADSFLTVGAGVLARDIPGAFGHTVARPARWGRIGTVGLLLTALLFASSFQDLVAYLGIIAFGSFAAALTPVLALGLNWKQSGRWAARSSILAGLLGGTLFEACNRWEIFTVEVAPGALALALSLLTFLLVGFLTTGLKPAD